MPMVLAFLLGAALAATPAPAPEPTATPPSPERVLGYVRAAFRAHRPPPPFVTYTLVRAQKTEQGYPDYVESYTYHIYCRTSDRASLARRVYRDTYRGDPEFQRPAFNEERDPGPPTADLFEPAPIKSHPISFVPTPEPTREELRQIGTVKTIGEFDYKVVAMERTDEQIHLSIVPTRDVLRNRLRELWVDAKTYELQKVVATDRLFVQNGPIYGVTFTITLKMLQGFPIVTDIHGVIGDNYHGDGETVDFQFRDVAFPATLPDWYFDARAYGQHLAEMPK
jgi:hypothetical protein